MQFPEIGGKIVVLERCDSTNSELIRMGAEESTISGTVVLAYEQTSGRGQRGNTWQSEAGKDLTFSFIISSTAIKAEHAFMPVAATALAVKNWTEKWLPRKKTEIKWPNDILCNGKKISGMLIENTFSGGLISRSVVGIGINLASENFGKTRFPATSLLLESGIRLKQTEALMDLLPFLNEYFGAIFQNPQGLMGEYNAALYGKHYPVKALLRDQETQVKVIQVAKSGELTVKLPDGEIYTPGPDELKFIP